MNQEEDMLRCVIVHVEEHEFFNIIAENKCFQLKTLLLTNHNNCFFYSDYICEISGIEHKTSQNINQYKKIYFISDDYECTDEFKKEHNISIPIENIQCYLSTFIKRYPQFMRPYIIRDYFSTINFVYDTLYDKSCRSSYLPGSYIFQNLMIGESYDINKLDIKRMYRYLDKNVKKEVAKELDDFDDE